MFKPKYKAVPGHLIAQIISGKDGAYIPKELRRKFEEVRDKYGIPYLKRIKK